MPTTALNGIDLSYRVAGSGHRLLFVNGTGATLANTGAMVDLLAQDFEVVGFDQRGLGSTTVPDDAYAMSDLAADALALADHLGWHRFRLMGISFGGMVAQEIAATSPDRIVRLALLCTSSGGAGGASFPLQTLADKPADERAAAYVQIVDTRFSPEWLEGHQSDRALIEMLTQHVSAEKTGAVRKGEAMQLAARSTHDVYDRLPRISCPTLVAGGRFDGIAPPANSTAIAARIPGAQLRLFEGGHLFFVQDPAAFPEIVGFLGAGRTAAVPEPS